jgi:hypothetical protein
MFLHHCENLKYRTWRYNRQRCGWFMLGKLNDKYIILFANTVFNAAVLCTTSVLVCFTSPNKTRKEIVLLVTATCRSRRECSTHPMIRRVLGAT